MQTVLGGNYGVAGVHGQRPFSLKASVNMYITKIQSIHKEITIVLFYHVSMMQYCLVHLPQVEVI